MGNDVWLPVEEWPQVDDVQNVNLNYCQVCGKWLGMDDYDGICTECDAEEEEEEVTGVGVPVEVRPEELRQLPGPTTVTPIIPDDIRHTLMEAATLHAENTRDDADACPCASCQQAAQEALAALAWLGKQPTHRGQA